MNSPSNQPTNSAPWLLIIGLALGGGLLALMAWDVFPPHKGPSTSSANVIELTNANWQEEVINSKVPVLVDFTAKWCGPCQMLAPTIDKIADRYKGKVKVCRFDVGDDSFNKGAKLAAEYKFGGIPYLLIFKDGEPRMEFKEGARTTETQLANALDRLLR